MGRREDGKEGRGDLKCGRFFRSPLTDNLFIPFKRENVSELDTLFTLIGIGILFRFPSNGKAYLNRY